MTENQKKIGVYICHCGTNIAGNADQFFFNYQPVSGDFDYMVRLESLTLNKLRQFSPAFGPDVAKYISLDACVDRRLSAGGTSSRRVSEAIQQAKQVLRRS